MPASLFSGIFFSYLIRVSPGLNQFFCLLSVQLYLNEPDIHSTVFPVIPGPGILCVIRLYAEVPKFR